MVKGRKKRTVATTRTKKIGPPSSPLSDASNVWTESQGKASSAGSTRTTPPVTRSSRIDDYFPTLSAGMATAEEVANEHSYSRRRPVKRVPCPLPQLVEPEVQIPCPDAAALPAGLSLTATQPPSPPCTDTQTAATKPSGRSNKSAKSASRATHTSVTKVTAKASAPAAQQDAPKPMKRKVDVQCHSLTEYFPIRRSARKTKTTLAKEKQKHVEDAILNGIEDGFKIIEFADKGRGVTSTRPLKSGDFVLENKQYCVDATKETGRLGRLVNHSKRGNLRTQVCIIKGVPHLVLVAQRNIEPGEELLYDYGDRSKASLQFHPWLAL
ncbi:hypothetical protein V5799_005701 [Amblyomma americanum]|uniref:SET domain-containing protein n=1 Tax=Amblyomma americanum TaxID=6943 RepID=A0AAQ4DYI2_AMBAM